MLRNSKQPHKLVIRPNDLRKGRTYKFTLTVKQGALTGKADLFLSVVSSRLVVQINKSSGSVSNSMNLHLSGRGSYDPDNRQQTLNYLWTCTEGREECRDLFNQPVLTQPHRRDITISKGRLKVGDLYKFTLTVSSKGRESSSSIQLEIRSAGNAFIESPQSRLRLNCQ